MFNPKKSLNDEELKSGLNYLVKDGIASQIMISLTGGAFLIAFAVALGASNLIIGILAAIPFLLQLVQLPSIFIVEKIRNRRLICFSAAGISRLIWIFIILIPFFFFSGTALIVLLTSLILSSAFSALAGCSWNSWMSDLVPNNIRGSFFSKRLRISLIFSIFISLIASFFIYYLKTNMPNYELVGYSLLFSVGIFAGLIGTFFISKIPEPKMIRNGKKNSILKILLKPFKDKNFRNLIYFLGSWSFAINLAGPFFIVYMLKRLELTLPLIIILSITSQIMNILFLKIWGKFTDKFSNKSVLLISCPLFIFSILAWTFTTLPEKYFLTIPLLFVIHAFMGAASAGVSIASGNISLKLAPRGQATSYLATNSVISSISAGIAPIIGGLTADFFATKELAWNLTYISLGKTWMLPTLNLQQWDFLFFFAFLMGLYSLHRLVAVREEGEVEEKIVINELFAAVKHEGRILTSIGGIHNTINIPFSFFKNLKNKINKKKK